MIHQSDVSVIAVSHYRFGHFLALQIYYSRTHSRVQLSR